MLTYWLLDLIKQNEMIIALKFDCVFIHGNAFANVNCNVILFRPAYIDESILISIIVINDLVSDDINTITVRKWTILFDMHFHLLADLLSINIDDIGVVQIYIRDGQNEAFAEWLSHKLQVVYWFKKTCYHTV